MRMYQRKTVTVRRISNGARRARKVRQVRRKRR